ncbi:MAG: spermidine/putrescine ABC transporter substrate-binding protein [Rhodoglobus sp.]
MTSKLSQDPIIRELVQQAKQSRLSRRHLLQGVGIGAGALALAACAPVGSSASAPAPAVDRSDSQKLLNWSNWPGDLDQAPDGSYPTLLAFEDKTGIKVGYKADIQDNNAYYNTIKDHLARGEETVSDTFCLTDWMVARLIRFGYVQELDAANIPNKKNLAPALLNPDYDAGRAMSMPWLNGFAGLAWNTEEVPNGLREVDDLWDPKLKGKVSVLSEMRDTMGLILLSQGVDISKESWGADEFAKAINVLEKQLKDGQLLGIKGNEYVQDLVSGDVVAAIAWSGDITVLNADAGYEKWKFVLPDSGGTLWGDVFVVPMGSPRKKNVETLINYYYEPEVAAEVAASVNYITPVVGAQAVAAEKYPEIADNPLIFPSEATLAQAHTFRSLQSADDQAFNSEFQRVQAEA